MSTLYYTGIGARKTPNDILPIMTEIAEHLHDAGWVLRSGAAEGADTAFEKGAGDLKDIFLPWYGFNDSTSKLFHIPEKAFYTASRIHPNWKGLSQGAQKMHARNVQQITGKMLNVRSKFVVCWTPEGKVTGGTATALILAEICKIPIFNLYIKDPVDVLAYAEKVKGINL